MSIVAFFTSQFRPMLKRRAGARVLACPTGRRDEIRRGDWPQSMTDPTSFYEWCFRYFHLLLPEELRAHRLWYRQNLRGFGEDTFHVMWFLLDREFGISNFLEIGVYRGQTISLVALLQKRAGRTCDVTGISPFSPATDSVSRYLKNVDYQRDTLANFQYFGLPAPALVKAYSTDPVARDTIRSRVWDCIYIDGNHEYEIARADWEICSAHVKPGGLIVLDDSALHTTLRSSALLSTGHPGPSRLAGEIDRQKFREILQVGHNRVFQRI